MPTPVIMPQMGESIAEGTIIKWMKKVGDAVKRDEPLFEISTDKVDAEIPAPASGVLAQIMVTEGQTVAINTVVGTIAAEGEAHEATPAAKPAADVKPSAPVAAKPVAAPAPATPQQGTDRAAAATQTQADGSEKKPASEKKLVPPPISGAPHLGGESQSRPPAATGPVGVPRDSDAPATKEELRRTRSSPLVRRIAAEHNVDIRQLEGTGISGRVTKNDIMSHLAKPEGERQAPLTPVADIRRDAAPAHRPGSSLGEVVPLSIMRTKIAEHMILSQRTSAHVATVWEMDMSHIGRLRRQHRAELEGQHGVKITFLPFIIQALIDALRAFPIFNSSLDANSIVYHRDINLGIAVALDWGLIVPVIKRADELSLVGLARASQDLAERARTKKLNPDEVAGGTFTLTNPGVFGSLFGTPIINQPQVAILGLGTIEKRPVVVTAADGTDMIAIKTMAYFALSFDHRLIDGAIADQFMLHIKKRLASGSFA